MSNRRNSTHLSAWQKAARGELRTIAAQHPGEVTVRSAREADGTLLIDLVLNTRDLRDMREPGGLRLEEAEEFTIAVGKHMLVPPIVGVRHDRFLGFTHVLEGRTLCLYLDPSREWEPLNGMRGLLNRLWDWLDDAVHDRFDPATALYHAVGGVPHTTEGTPSIVVRHPIDATVRILNGHLRRRTDRRYDHRAGPATSIGEIPMPVFVVPFDLPFGAGQDRLLDLLQRLDYADHPPIPTALVRPPSPGRVRLAVPDLASASASTHGYCQWLPGRHIQLWPGLPPPAPAPAPPSTATALLTALAASAARQPDGAEQYVLLGVPHPAGGPPHLLGLRLPGTVGDALRLATRRRTTPILNLRSTDVFPEIAMEWCHVSDERDAVTLRRDQTRPVNALAGKTVHVWGCGGIGSWIAEFVVRAGAKKVILCDPSTVTGGLLVRQNYVETDIGDAKAEGLAQRLRAISDSVEVEASPVRLMLPQDWAKAAIDADLIIDATISNAIAHFTEALAADPRRRATIAQVATDARTGTLAFAIVATPGATASIRDVDKAAGAFVARTSVLEAYRTFWTEPASGDELTPTRGCSAPTFHGSAADMAGVAGVLVSLIGLSMQASVTGTHLAALPHSGVSPPHRFVPYTSTADETTAA